MIYRDTVSDSITRYCLQEHTEAYYGSLGSVRTRSTARGGRFGRGDLRLVILEMLENHPSYGYEIMRALEQRFHGFYSPSAGTIYPTLQWLQDLGYVTVAEQDGRKIYTITDEGRRFLAAGEPRVDEIWERMRGWAGPFDQREFREEMRHFTERCATWGVMCCARPAGPAPINWAASARSVTRRPARSRASSANPSRAGRRPPAHPAQQARRGTHRQAGPEPVRRPVRAHLAADR